MKKRLILAMVVLGVLGAMVLLPEASADTITICKQTVPPGSLEVFSFTRSNTFSPLPPFSLGDGDCMSFDVTTSDHFNGFQETVPLGWTLTNIICDASATSPVNIIGADPNPAFQPGDNEVTIDLNETTITCLFVNTQQCPLTQGFWANHPELWPVDSLTLGGQSYDQAALLTILRTSPKGDASVILARQLIAAKLNIANGADSTPIASTLADADKLLSGSGGTQVPPSSPTRQAMISAAQALDDYNNGLLTPDCH